ncbi:MAG: type II toxin-antitoxin system RelE/ParE family toxin [Methylococcales bacterium]|nr:type II toxin-antitoxin system RelE/ParE family toxin [Methylococcales bacterium]
MSYQAFQTSRFGRQYKKLHDNVARDVDSTVIDVANNPLLGEKKKGDLANLYVYKLHSQNQLYLLGYTIEESVRFVYLEAVASHENFYRDLKRK